MTTTHATLVRELKTLRKGRGVHAGRIVARAPCDDLVAVDRAHQRRGALMSMPLLLLKVRGGADPVGSHRSLTAQ